jgi:hypothetical protein
MVRGHVVQERGDLLNEVVVKGNHPYLVVMATEVERIQLNFRNSVCRVLGDFESSINN